MGAATAIAVADSVGYGDIRRVVMSVMLGTELTREVRHALRVGSGHQYVFDTSGALGGAKPLFRAVEPN